MYGSIPITPGSGRNVAVDTVTGIDYQRFKASWGAEGTINAVDTANPLPVALVPAAVTTFHRVTTDGTNAVLVIGGAHKLRSVHAYNNCNYPVHWKFSDKASAPTVGTDAVLLTVSANAGQPRDVPIDGGGKAFALGIAVCCTKLLLDADTTPVVAGDSVVDIFFE